jgi:RNA polymerase sigma-70 factor, ECF subfamily
MSERTFEDEPELSPESQTPPCDPSLNELFSAAYTELKRLAYSVRRSDNAATINPTALVNEAYLKLCREPQLVCQSRQHFSRIAARAMRQILVESARRRMAVKRGGNQKDLTVADADLQIASTSADIIALNEALDDLERLNPRQASVVETRFFGGFSEREVAELLGISEATVLRDWRLAKAFLGVHMNKRSAAAEASS